jgi:microcystin-dependent protein
MALGYAQQTWTDNVTPADAAHMNHIEAGVGLLDGGKVDSSSVVVAGSPIVTNKLLSTDTQNAFQVLGSGQINWGAGGATASDLTVSRGSAKTLMVGLYSQGCAFQIMGDSTLWPFVVYDRVTNAYPHFVINNNGGLNWGSKSAATDTDLYRSGVNTLKTDGALVAVGTASGIGFVFQPGTAAGNSLASFSPGAGDTAYRYVVDVNGKTVWGPGNVAGDTNLYRGGPGMLQTDGTITVVGGVSQLGINYNPATVVGYSLRSIVSGDTAPRFRIDVNGLMQWGPGNTAVDTTLSRFSAGSVGITSADPSGISLMLSAGYLYRSASAPGLTLFGAISSGDTNFRFSSSVSGALAWGPGNTAGDTTLQRGGVGLLQLGTTTQRGWFRIQSDAVGSVAFIIANAAEAEYRLRIMGDGSMRWGDGVVAGGDTTLARTAASKLSLTGSLDVSGTLSVAGVPVGGGAGLPTGAVCQFAGSAAPAGYLICDGSAVSRTTYSALFTAIGTTYGAGDGTTTFNLPNLQQRVPVGVGTGYVLGASGGEASHVLAAAEMPSHNHGITGAPGITDPGHTHGPAATRPGNYMVTYGTGSGTDPSNGSGTHWSIADDHVTGSSTTGITPNAGSLGTAAAGSGAAHNVMQPYLVLNYIIKT